jgi:hypothetical protein
MRFASFPKFALLSLLAVCFALALSGCGSNSASNLALTPGNWSVTATPSGGAAFYIGGNLTQTGNNLAGTMYVVNSNTTCFNPSQQVAFTGTVSGNKVTLTSASTVGQVIAIIATGTTTSGTTSSALTGTYTVTGGCDDGDSGTASANSVPSISATWSGPILDDGYGDPNVTLSIAFVQSTTASSDGTFALTGNATYTGSSCSVSGTVNNAFIAGPYLVVNASTVEVDGSSGSFSYIQVLLNSPASPSNMKGEYIVNDGLCAGDDTNNTTFTKQQ